MPKSSRKRHTKRTVDDYKASATELSKYVPSLKPLKFKKKTLSRSDKWRISYWGKKLRYMPNLIPLTPSQAKKLKRQLISPLVHAMQLTNVGKVDRLKFVNNEMFIGANGRTFLFWRTDDLSELGMSKLAEKAFDQSYPIEKIAKLAELAFNQFGTKAIYLWSDHGNVGAPFYNIKEFVQWLLTDYSKYQNVHRWVNGIAILLHDALPPKESREALQKEAREAKKTETWTGQRTRGA